MEWDRGKEGRDREDNAHAQESQVDEGHDWATAENK
jgi:hypothetical protein